MPRERHFEMRVKFYFKIKIKPVEEMKKAAAFFISINESCGLVDTVILLTTVRFGVWGGRLAFDEGEGLKHSTPPLFSRQTRRLGAMP